jgi:hypothetical protein
MHGFCEIIGTKHILRNKVDIKNVGMILFLPSLKNCPQGLELITVLHMHV